MISVIIDTFNRLNFTQKCLEFLRRGTDIQYELIIVDNGSTDGTVEWLEKLQTNEWKNCTKFTLIKEEVNLGSAKVINHALSIATGDFLVRINNDVILPCGWSSHLMKAFAHLPDAIFGANVFGYVERVAGNRRIDCKIKRTSFDDGVIFDEGQPNVGGWFFAMSKATQQKIGLFMTPKGVLYGGTDYNYDRRAKALGLRIGYLHSLVVLKLADTLGDTPEYRHFKDVQMKKCIAKLHGEWET